MAKKASHRISSHPKEIFGVIDRSQGSPDAFIWQNIEGSRTKIPAIVRELDSIKMILKLELLKPEAKLDTTQPIFVKCPIQDSAFKTTSVERSGKQIVLEIPDEVVLSENRNDKRYPFHPQDKKTITLRRATGHDTKSIITQTLNISKTGAGVFLTISQASGLSPKDPLELLALSDYKFSEPVKGEVAYKIPFERKGQLGTTETGFKLGIRLLGQIPSADFERFILVERTLKVDDERLVKDQTFRNSVHRGMSKTVANIQSHPKMKNLLEKLQISRDDTNYIRNHIDMLCEVTCGVGKSLGWMTDQTMEKLIYVSYLHDLLYFDRPHLARIKDKRDFEFQKSSLSKEDQEIFLQGPLYAAQMAREDENSFPDAEKILIQHRETPDGSGFPYGIRANQLAPLTCLFIICHRFVDYVLENPNWTYNEFVRSNNRVFKGPYFQKIFQIFEELNEKKS